MQIDVDGVLIASRVAADRIVAADAVVGVRRGDADVSAQKTARILDDLAVV